MCQLSLFISPLMSSPIWTVNFKMSTKMFDFHLSFPKLMSSPFGKFNFKLYTVEVGVKMYDACSEKWQLWNISVAMVTTLTMSWIVRIDQFPVFYHNFRYSDVSPPLYCHNCRMSWNFSPKRYFTCRMGQLQCVARKVTIMKYISGVGDDITPEMKNENCPNFMISFYD